MTNRVEALFEPVLMRLSTSERSLSLGSKHYCQHRLLHTLALWCCWHHCDIGITGARACSSKKWRLLCFDTGSAWSEVPFFLSVQLTCCIDRWRVRCPPHVAPNPLQALIQSTVMLKSPRLEVMGRVLLRAFIFFQMLLIFLDPAPFTKPHPQVLHIWWVKNDGHFFFGFAQQTHVCAFWYIFFFVIFLYVLQ